MPDSSGLRIKKHLHLLFRVERLDFDLPISHFLSYKLPAISIAAVSRCTTSDEPAA